MGASKIGTYLAAVCAWFARAGRAVYSAYRAAESPIRDKLRAGSMLVLGVAAFGYMRGVNAEFADGKQFAFAFITARIALGVYLGYWADRILFPKSRPDRVPIGISQGAAEKRRAHLVGFCVLGACLNL